MGNTCFQEHHSYVEEIDVKSDIAIVYGADETFEKRIKLWKGKGYCTYFMTGIAWGDYRDYDNGSFDGKNHLEEAQMNKREENIGHGRGINYMVPTQPYIEYMKSKVKKAIDGGSEAIVIEEPEFWIRGGYSPAFKREWRTLYGEEWKAPHSSVDSAYKSAKLMHRLYFDALREVMDFVKSYAKEQRKEIRCLVATHSLINYSHWRIVSPEFSMNEIKSIDGYIGQVWTGTARTPNYYNGIKNERTFETSYLEYGVLANMVEGNGRQMWFLADPIEDDPRHNWLDYKKNYEATLIASLLYPEVKDYEVMPWPNRIFCGKYPKMDIKELETSDTELKPTIEIDGPSKLIGYDVEMEGIPSWYAEEILRVNNMLSDMEQQDINIGKVDIKAGILLSNSMMFERLESLSSDNDLGDFYGIALPLLKHGIPVKPVQFEGLRNEELIKNYDVLFLCYDSMKPLSLVFHSCLAEWIKRGGVLIFLGNCNSPYNEVDEWWNTPPYDYNSPGQHLFELLGIGKSPEEGIFIVGEGKISVNYASPSELSKKKDGAEILLQTLKNALSLKELEYQNYIKVERGPYTIAWVFDEVSDSKPLVFKGNYIDILDKNCRHKKEITVLPGEGVILYNLDKSIVQEAKVIFSSSRIKKEKKNGGILSFQSFGPADTRAVTCIYADSDIKGIHAADSRGNPVEIEENYNKESKLLYLSWLNHTEGVSLSIELVKK